MKKQDDLKLKIIPLGGLEQIGMNMTAFEYGDSIIVVDCGLAFPNDDMLGIDLVIPDITYLMENAEKVKGFFITHGHEDHIGALPYILNQIPAPVYGTRLTIGIIEMKLRDHMVPADAKRRTVRYGQNVSAGVFRVEFIRVNHSIPDSAALAITTPEGIVVHTGDFKIDYSPVSGEPTDFSRLAELGKKGVLALLCESTNALREGFSEPERAMGCIFDNIFAEYDHNRIIVATFSSNIDRLQQILNAAERYGRKVVLDGRSLINVIYTARDLGYLTIPQDMLVEMEQAKALPPEQIVWITNGSLGAEVMAPLSRITTNLYRKMHIAEGDTIVLSSNPVPGTEKALYKVINDLTLLGANVIFQDTHVSGHAWQEEIKLMYSLLKPQYAIPIHGEYRHLQGHAKLAQRLGIPADHVFVMHSGEILEIGDGMAQINGRVPVGAVLVDGLGVGDVGNIVLRDRQVLAKHGIIVAALVMEKGSNRVISGPEIVTRGYVYVRESEELITDIQKTVMNAVVDCQDRRITDWNKIRNHIREELNDYLWKRMKRNPMILPIIMEG